LSKVISIVVVVKKRVVATAIGSLAILSACQTAPQPAAPSPAMQVTATTLGPAPRKPQPGDTVRPAEAAVPVSTAKAQKTVSEENLHSIAGRMLEFYATFDRMPPSLISLRQIDDADDPLTLTCPETGQPYGYSPSGLSRPDLPMKLYVWEPQPSADGLRECLVSSQSPGYAMQLDVQEVGEADFHVFQSGGELSPGAHAPDPQVAQSNPTPMHAPSPDTSDRLSSQQMQKLQAAMHGTTPNAAPAAPAGSDDFQSLTPDQLQFLRTSLHQQRVAEGAAPDDGIVPSGPDPSQPQMPPQNSQPIFVPVPTPWRTANPVDVQPPPQDNSPSPDILPTPGF
jgi:hypothetical protein